MDLQTMSQKEQERKEMEYRALCAAETLKQAEKIKQDKELMKFVKAEIKSQKKLLDKVDAAPKKQAPKPMMKAKPKKK